jgi:hypothetical protein
MKRSLGAADWVKRGLGVAVLIAVAAVASGLDTGFLTNVSLSNTASLEQSLIARLRPQSHEAGGSTQSSVVMNGNPSMMMNAHPNAAGPNIAVHPCRAQWHG